MLDIIDWDLISSYAGLLSLATLSIYTGSYGSLPAPKLPLGKGIPAAPTVSDNEEDEEDQPERLSSGDAWLFPVIGSVLLFGLYIIVKYVGKAWINWFLQWYFTIAGIGSGGKALVSLVRWTIGRERWTRFDRIRVGISKGLQRPQIWRFRTPTLFLIPFGALPSILYNFGGGETRRSALLTDILALSFSFNALSLLTIDSFKTGCILLSGLFLYDVWWVFGTDVMVKVATNLDVPIKLLWAKSTTFSTDRGFTMLGLGDIVVPGMFVALALRYDHHRASVPNKTVTSFPKPYFYAALTAYVLGLVTTMTVMHVFKAAQPALLYLSPACILSFLLTAFFRGEFAEAWKWSDDPAASKEQGPAEGQQANGNAKSPTKRKGSSRPMSRATSRSNINGSAKSAAVSQHLKEDAKH